MASTKLLLVEQEQEGQVLVAKPRKPPRANKEEV